MVGELIAKDGSNLLVDVHRLKTCIDLVKLNSLVNKEYMWMG